MHNERIKEIIGKIPLLVIDRDIFSSSWFYIKRARRLRVPGIRAHWYSHINTYRVTTLIILF